MVLKRMQANTILLIYLIFFAGEFLFENLLTLLNIKTAYRNKDSVPAPFQKYIEKDKYTLSVVYTIERSKFNLLTSVLSSGFLLFVVLSGLLGKVDLFVSGMHLHPYLHGIIYIFLISLIFKLFSIPFSIYSQFVIEEKFGFNRMTLSLFFKDLIKSLLVSAVISTPLLLGLFWFMDSTGRFWWIFAFLFVALFQLVITVLYPLVIAPLFNKFSPLEEGSLKEKLYNLAKKLAFRTSGIFVMDGSKRSRHSNAYFTGLGKVKRIVLFDTLIQTLTENQLAAVLAHEIGHEKKHHAVKYLFLSLLLMMAALFIIDLLLRFDPLYLAFGFKQASYHGILVIISFCSGPFTFFLTPLFTSWSRKHEYEADRFAVNAVENKENLEEALITLGRENLTNLSPHPLYSFYHYSHPTLGERIRAIEKYKPEKGV
ncbi:MAG: M48 family peptidase [Spirochaetes bacterium]|nr:MAG: M48 family peptidase [Spirochaetota bacterium]